MRKLWLVVWLLVLARPAHAYVDPSSGLLLLQGLLAFIGGAIAFVRHPIDKLRAIWRWLSRRRDA
jgi:hypothetical protein